jgi:hypothetical protein
MVECPPSQRVYLISKHGGEPFGRLLNSHTLAPGVVDKLVPFDSSNTEVTALGMRKVQAAHRSRRIHSERLRQSDTDVRRRTEQLEDRLLLCVIRTRRIPRCGPNSLISLADEFLIAEGIGLVAPQFCPHPMMQVLGAGFGQTVGKSLEHDRRVVVVLGLERSGPFAHTGPRADGKGPDVILDRCRCRCNEVSQRPIGAVISVADLLAKRVQPS